MKLALLCVGTIRDEGLRRLAADYAKRIPRFMQYESITVPDVRTPSLSPEAKSAKEGEAILAKLAPSDFVVLFDEAAREMTSVEFATFIESKANASVKRLVFIIGGPFGFSDRVYARADFKLSLSRMTFTHEMAQTIAVEQIYRALSITAGLPYHHI